MHPEIDRLRNDHGWNPEDVAEPSNTPGLWLARGKALSSSAFSSESSELVDSLVDESWWFQTRNEIIRKRCSRELRGVTLWDVGCGTGFVSEHVADKQHGAIGIEPSLAGAQASVARGLSVFCGTLESLVLPSGSIHAFGLFDVLEHLVDRTALLAEIRRVMAPDASLLVTLPAHSFLWSSIDVLSSHQLRYTRRSATKELEEAGFQVDRIGYFFVTGVPSLLLTRVIPERLNLRWMTARSSELNVKLLQSGPSLFSRVFRLLEVLLAMRAPFGSSLLVIAKKAGD